VPVTWYDSDPCLIAIVLSRSRCAPSILLACAYISRNTAATVPVARLRPLLGRYRGAGQAELLRPSWYSYSTGPDTVAMRRALRPLPNGYAGQVNLRCFSVHPYS
jgi:hypothetical protein